MKRKILSVIIGVINFGLFMALFAKGGYMDSEPVEATNISLVSSSIIAWVFYEMHLGKHFKEMQEDEEWVRTHYNLEKEILEDDEEK